VDVELAQLLSAEIAHKCQAAPLKRSGMLLTVAMTDPLDINSLDTIEVHTNYEVEAVICTEQHLNQLLTTVYGTFAGIGGVLEDMEEMEIDKSADKTTTLDDVEVSSLQGMAEEAPVVRLVNSILSHAKAPAIFISARRKTTFRSASGWTANFTKCPPPPRVCFFPSSPV
jgi:type IV pilus assembly protein PilB